MPIEAPSGTLDIENAKLRVSEFSATTGVGIGTENTQNYPLYIYKASEPELILQEGSVAAAKFTSNNGSLFIQSGATLSNNSDGDIVFSDMGVNTRHVTIKGATGNVGIGTANPACKLDITGEDVMIRGSTPSINFSESTNGMDGAFRIRYDGANQNDNNNFLAVQTGPNCGVSALHMTYGGNVGIGTTSPSYKLNVLTDTNYDGISLRDSTRELLKIAKGNNGAYINMYDSSVSKVNIATSGVSWLNGGNVGIGTADPDLDLHVMGAIMTQNNGTITPQIQFKSGSNNTNGWLVRANISDTYAGDFTIDRQDNSVTPSKFVIKNDGNVGIGTANPSYKLHLIGDIAMSGGTSNYNSSLRGGYTNRMKINMHLDPDTNDCDRMTISLHDDECVRIRRNYNSGINSTSFFGNVGIGTTSPGEKLDIYGTGVGSRLKMNGNGYVGRYYNDGVAKGSALHFTGSAIYPADYNFSLSNGGINFGYSVYRWGQIYSTSSTISTSDRNLKQDIADITDSERRVASKIIPLLKTFRMKDAVEKKGDEARTHTGIIAQDLIVAFESEGLDAHRYGLFCYDEKWTVDGEHELMETTYEKDGISEYTNEDGEVVKYTSNDEGVEAVKRWLGIVADKSTPGAVFDSGTYSIRYEELLCFVVSALAKNEDLQAEKVKVATLE